MSAAAGWERLRNQDFEAAQAFFEKALALDSHDGDAHRGLAQIDLQFDRPHEAGAHLRESMKPPFRIDDLHCLGMVLEKLGQADQALAILNTAWQTDPRLAKSAFLLAWLHNHRGDPDQALAWLAEAGRLQPPTPEVQFETAKALLLQGRFAESLTYHHELLRINPGDALTHNNLGIAYYRLNDDARSLHHFAEALRLRPGYAGALGNRSLVWLRQGDYERGWPEYEYRPSRRTIAESPAWQGEPIEGKTILVLAEQGLGDMLHFLRYAPLLRAKGAKVIVEMPKTLLPMLERSAGADAWVALGDPFPPHDMHVSLASLPLRTKALPAPYPLAKPIRAEAWRRELSRLPGKKIGIAWQGNPKMPLDCLRSFRLRAFVPLAQVPGVTLVSLQKHFGLDQIPTAGVPLVDWSERIDRDEPFLDTAAIMTQLDWVIVPDSVLAHLAGALGVPTWLVLSTSSDWRWGRDRGDTPWYPAMRLFRQQQLGDWDEVFGRLSSAGEVLRTPGTNVRGW